MVALLSELNGLFGDKGKTEFKELLTTAGDFVKNIVPIAAKVAIKKVTGENDVADLIEKTVESSLGVAQKELEEYNKKKSGLLAFKTKLKKFIDAKTDSKPVVIIIDELDRCKPSYAVEVLEQVKHFFNVEGVVYVLSIDKVQLGNSIKGYYGSESINSIEYLKRFIDVEFSIPEPDREYFCNYLFKYFELGAFFNTPERLGMSEVRNDGDNFIKMAGYLFKKHNMNLRQIEKIISHFKIVLIQYKQIEFVLPKIILQLLVIKEVNPKLFKDIINRKKNSADLFKEIIPILKDDIIETWNFNVKYDLSLFIFLYNQYFQEINTDYKIAPYNSDTRIYEFPESFGTHYEILNEFFNSHNKLTYSHYPFQSILDRITLSDQIA